MKNKKKRRGDYRFLIAATLVILFIRVSLYDGIRIRTYFTESLAVKREHTFVILSDLHSTIYGTEQERLLSEIDKVSPEAIFLLGDIGDDKRGFGGAKTLLLGISGKYPCYYVTGNHERWVEYTKDIRNLFERYGVTVLSERSISLGDSIVLHGMDDPTFFNNEDEYLSAVKHLKPSESSFDILLAHRPEYSEKYAELGFDLILCGHAHGGQVRVPFASNGLYASGQGFLPKYSGGKYTLGESIVIVSRGLMLNEIPRIFNPPEIVVIQIK